MKKDLMSLNETTIAAMNLKSIENMLGHEVPPGMIDATELSDGLLDLNETTKIAMNIESMEYMKSGSSQPTSNLELGIYAVGAVFVIIMILIAIV